MLTRQQQAIINRLKRIKADRVHVVPETLRELWAARRTLTPREDGKWGGAIQELEDCYAAQECVLADKPLAVKNRSESQNDFGEN